jgi:hypothetical protein
VAEALQVKKLFQSLIVLAAIAAGVAAILISARPYFFGWIVSAVQYTDAHNSLISAIATVLLACVTGGLVVMAYLQIKTTREQLRAYVFPDSAVLCDGMALSPPIPGKANEPGVVLAWKNTGQTPASNVISWGQVAVIEPINESRLTVPPLQSVFASHLGAGSVGTKSLWFGRALTPSEIADIAAGARAIYLFGRIEYSDIFRKKRFTNFRLAYAGIFPPPPGVIFNVCEKGNEAQ